MAVDDNSLSQIEARLLSMASPLKRTLEDANPAFGKRQRTDDEDFEGDGAEEESWIYRCSSQLPDAELCAALDLERTKIVRFDARKWFSVAAAIMVAMDIL